MNPSDWPVAVKKYVEKCFRFCKPSQRENLQAVLRLIIHDAQSKGELYSRPWSTLPVPDLNLKPQDAASIVIKFSYQHTQPLMTSYVRPMAVAKPTMVRFGIDARTPPTSALESHRGRGGDGSGAGMYKVPHIAPNATTSIANNNNTPTTRTTVTNKNNKRPYSALLKEMSKIPGQPSNNSTVSQGGAYANDEDIRRQQRAGRFKHDSKVHKSNIQSNRRAAHARARIAAMHSSASGEGDVVDWDAFALKGTCKKLEKSYFRLTSAPDPSTVRPEPVLRKALARLVGLIASGDVNYFYAQDQFKGMRQDCVVQALQGPLAIDVYEAHARAALEYGDMAEYNQCQGQLRYLYSVSKTKNKNETEFVAYRILYQTVYPYLHADKSELVGLLESLLLISSKNATTAAAPAVRHALDVRRALVSHNYALFFKLYESAPALGRALMDLAVPKMRFSCLVAFVKAFKPTVDVDFLCHVLGFIRSPSREFHLKMKSSEKLPGCSTSAFEGKYRGDDCHEDALAECLEWLLECGAVFCSDDSKTKSDQKIDCKETVHRLKMPLEKDAVAHGDANLDIADFLSPSLQAMAR